MSLTRALCALTITLALAGCASPKPAPDPAPARPADPLQNPRWSAPPAGMQGDDGAEDAPPAAAQPGEEAAPPAAGPSSAR